MKVKKVFVPRYSPRIIKQTQIQELIETSTDHITLPELRRISRIAEQARIREKMDMINKRKRQRRHDWTHTKELMSYRSAKFLREPNKSQS
ncbi:hypothetical protein MKX03_024965 [Papaver bracteatum]|nr:hypothetical protein MKX03_024965 [Papaver bracteatum]